MIYLSAFALAVILTAFYFSKFILPVFVPEREPMAVAGAFSIAVGGFLDLFSRKKYSLPVFLISIMLAYGTFHSQWHYGNYKGDRRAIAKSFSGQIGKNDFIIMTGYSRITMLYYLEKSPNYISFKDRMVSLVFKRQYWPVEEDQKMRKNMSSVIERAYRAGKDGGRVWLVLDRKKEFTAMNMDLENAIKRRFHKVDSETHFDMEIAKYSEYRGK